MPGWEDDTLRQVNEFIGMKAYRVAEGWTETQAIGEIHKFTA